jgi:hypothetical protein
MKKIAILTVLLFMVTVGSSFAAFPLGDAGTLVVGTTVKCDLKLSNNVGLAYTAQATGLGYVVATSHSSGTRTYGSSSGDSKIYYIDELDAVSGLTAPTGTASAGFTWTPM